MAKPHIPKETRSVKRVLVCILYHDRSIDLIKLLDKIKLNKKDDLLIIFDNLNESSLNIILKKKYRNIKLFFGTRKLKKVPYYRNIALNKASSKYEILLFLDSDVLPKKNIIENHYKYHKKYVDIPLIGGSVKPSFLIDQKTFWEKIDGCMTWFCSLEPKKNTIVKFPYHLATANISMKVKFLKANNIKFDNNLITGEDVDLSNKIRNIKEIMLAKNMEVIHRDRTELASFLEHQKNWGKHHYYIRYKNNILFKKRGIIFYILFFLFYPFLAPFISIIATYYNMKALMKFKITLVSLSIIIYLVYLYKCLYTYAELFRDLKK